MDLPHCWNGDDTFQVGTVPYRGWGSYRTAFRLPAGSPRGGVWRVESEGFYGLGDVWLNGIRLGRVDGQYLGFALECGHALALEGCNRLGIRLTNRCPLRVLPGHPSPDFILHGGLTGRVRLVHRPGTRIAARTVAVTTRSLGQDRATATLSWSVIGEAGHLEPAQLEWRILDAGGTPIAASEPRPLAAEDLGAARPSTTLELANPLLWSVGQPHLHTAEGRLLRGGEVVDRVTLRFGVREAEFRRDGFFLNRERVLLQGCNRHESVPGLGQALPESLQRDDARRLKDLGCNFVRLAHYPQHSAFLDACDELGLVVYAEVASWKSVRSGRWLESAVRQLEGMILRDRNHPSIAIWGLGNESRSRRAYTVLRGRARELDPTRPVTYAENHLSRARWNRIGGIPDVWSVNYELSEIGRARRMCRLGSVLVSECVPYRAARRGSDEAELAQVRTLVESLEEIDRHPQLAGYAVWAFADYATMHRRRFRRYSGLLDAWRTPKYAALALQARLSPAPFVRVVGPWGAGPGREGAAGGDDTRRIHVFSNCREVSLLHGGRQVATVACRLHGTCRLPFLGGELVAVARREDGTASDRLSAFGEPVGLAIEPEVDGGTVGPRDTVPLAVRVVDGMGVRVTTWTGDAWARVEGPARLRGFTPDGRVELARGLGRAFVTGTGRAGEVRVHVRCQGLEPAVASLRLEGGEA